MPRFTHPSPGALSDAAKIFLQNSVLSGIFAVKPKVRQIFRRALASQRREPLQKSQIGLAEERAGADRP
jgi:hypothetical protein